MTKPQTKKAAPVARLRVKTVQGSIFANAAENGTYFNTTFQIGYRDHEGQWRNGTSSDLSGLLALRHTVGLAIDKVIALQQADIADEPAMDDAPVA